MDRRRRWRVENGAAVGDGLGLGVTVEVGAGEGVGDGPGEAGAMLVDTAGGAGNRSIVGAGIVSMLAPFEAVVTCGGPGVMVLRRAAAVLLLPEMASGASGPGWGEAPV